MRPVRLILKWNEKEGRRCEALRGVRQLETPRTGPGRWKRGWRRAGSKRLSML